MSRLDLFHDGDATWSAITLIAQDATLVRIDQRTAERRRESATCVC